MDGDHDYVYGGECGTDDFYGFDVCVGDVNADNYLDALIGTVGANQVTGKVYLYYGPFYDTQNITFNWDTTNASIGKHTLKVEIPTVPGEQNTEDNVKTVTVPVVRQLKSCLHQAHAKQTINIMSLTHTNLSTNNWRNRC